MNDVSEASRDNASNFMNDEYINIGSNQDEEITGALTQQELTEIFITVLVKLAESDVRRRSSITDELFRINQRLELREREAEENPASCVINAILVVMLSIAIVAIVVIVMVIKS